MHWITAFSRMWHHQFVSHLCVTMFTRLALVQRGNASWITTIVINTPHSDLQIMSMNVLQQCRVILFLLFHFSLWNLFLLLLFRILIRFLFFDLLWSVGLFHFLLFQ